MNNVIHLPRGLGHKIEARRSMSKVRGSSRGISLGFSKLASLTRGGEVLRRKLLRAEGSLKCCVGRRVAKAIYPEAPKLAAIALSYRRHIKKIGRSPCWPLMDKARVSLGAGITCIVMLPSFCSCFRRTASYPLGKSACLTPMKSCRLEPEYEDRGPQLETLSSGSLKISRPQARDI